jgi:hypothetical protein
VRGRRLGRSKITISEAYRVAAELKFADEDVIRLYVELRSGGLRPAAALDAVARLGLAAAGVC